MKQSSNTFSFFLVLIAAGLPAFAADLIPLGAPWKYILGTQEASVPATAWRQPAFNDGAWLSGTAPLGYDTGGTPGTAPIATVLPDPRTAGNPVWNSAYFRKAFTITDPARVTSLILTLQVDDGAVAWLNGVEIGRINVPDGELPYNGAASVAAETRILDTTNIAGLLVAGNNVVAVHTFNGAAASTDFIFEGALNATLDEPPTVVEIEPFPSSIVTTLDFIDVTFSENVSGVDAADLRINGIAAADMTSISPREYVFNFPQPPTGVVTVAWAPAPGIADVDSTPDPFVPGPSWSYTLDPNVISAPVVISEFLADNENGIRDEDGTRSDWLELFNPGTADRNLGGWFLTDTTNNLTKWRLPSINLAANKYLLIWASEKNRTNASAPLHTNFRLSRNAGSFLALVDPQTNIVSAFIGYPAQNSDVSYGRDRVDPNLIGYFTATTPGAQNAISGSGFAPEPVFSLESGIYTNNSLTLTITAPAGTTVRYTYDGSEPTAASPLYAAPIAFSTNMMIKARLFQPGVFPSRVGARTFVMLDNSTRDFNSNIPVLIISTAGRAIPRNLPAGSARPRGTFVAVDTFRGRSSLQGKVDYHGLGQFEIVGQTSADFNWNGVPKPPYRIELNDELGNDRSEPLLGMPPEADWSLRSPFTDKCLMNDFLGYELWEEMGHYSCRRRMVEVFVDTGGGKLTYPGDYFGVYMLCERIEIGNERVDFSKLAVTHTNEPAITGGYIIKKDKDSVGDTSFTTPGGGGHSGHVLKFHDPKPSEITSAQSNWIRNFVFQFEASMYAPDWTNRTGPNHYSHYIDVDKFVDQHLHVEFTKQIDGYRLSSYYSKDRGGKLGPNPVWDWNLSFGNANYLRGGTTNGWYWNLQNVDEGMPSSKHIWLRRLIYGLPVITTSAPWTEANGPGDPDFRQRITDRWDVMRTNVLNGDRILARIDEVAAMLTEPAGRHYARFAGLLNSYTWPNPEGPPYDVDYTQPTYQAIIAEMKKWTKGRFVWMDNQFIRSPVLSREGGPISPGTTVTLGAPSGTIYYTLNGTDPRLPGGAISPAASVYSGPITLQGNARIVARAYLNPTALWTPWSAAKAASYVVATPRLVISEIMYEPASPASGTNAGSDFEYVEVKNVGTGTLNLAGASLGGGIDFVFPSYNLAPGQHVVVVNDQAAFVSRYGAGLPVAGEFSGNLANTGDHIVLLGPLGEPILDFNYSNEWYPITDGAGFALAIVDDNAPASAWGTKPQWRPGGMIHGTPGQPEPAIGAFARVVINEALTHSDPTPPFDTVELRNLEATNVNIGGWYLSDDIDTPKKFRMPAGTIIPANGYLTFDETAFNAGTGGNIAFGLGAQGDDLFLFSADAGGNLTGYHHGFEFGAAQNGVTFGRHVISTGDEHFVRQTAPTLGGPNSGARIGPVVIAEIMYRPMDVFANGAFWNNTEDEFIELRNITASPVNLSDPARPANTWQITGAVQFAFPTNTSIPAGGYVLVVDFNPATESAQLAAFRAKYALGAGIPIFGPYSGSLDNQDGIVALAMPDAPESDGTVPLVAIDQVHYRNKAPWPLTPDGLGHSLHRVTLAAYADDPINWAAGGPTPAAGYVGGSAPAITFHPLNQTGTAGGSATFSGNATGSGTIRYQWRFNGATLPGETNNTLELTNLQTSQAGEYQLLALNEFGSVLSSVATLTVIIPATITQQPGSLVVTNGDDAAFSVAAVTANPPLRYQWLHEGIAIPGATNATLSLTNVEEALHGGEYVVAVIDAVATAFSAPATLTILLPPSLVQPVPPLRITTVVGQTLHLGAETVGTRPMLYRWRRVLTNGANAIVANHFVNSHRDFLTIANVAAVFDNAHFTVTLTNAAYFPANRTYTNCILTVLPDSNGNGIPDNWEADYFGSSTGADRDADSDGDTMSNWDEYVAGTNPTNAASYLKVSRAVPGQAAEISFEAVSNRTYSVYYKDDLAAALWTRLTDVVARNANWTAVVADPAPGTNRFYRIAVPREE
jgi:hypothetical protein